MVDLIIAKGCYVKILKYKNKIFRGHVEFD